jgi:hypothetical protein
MAAPDIGLADDHGTGMAPLIIELAIAVPRETTI